jgi:hypothetical protein
VRAIYVYAVPGERWALIRGHVGRWLRDRRIPALRSPVNNGYWLWHERVPDVVALLEDEGHWVTFTAHTAPRHVPSDDSDLEVAA